MASASNSSSARTGQIEIISVAQQGGEQANRGSGSWNPNGHSATRGNQTSAPSNRAGTPTNKKTKPLTWVEVYESNLKKVKQIAVGTNIFYGLNWFLGFCALTWATTVVLGGMVTNIRRRDYYSVGVLLILEALRLATARFFSFFVTRHLINGSADPRKLVYNDCRELAAKEILRSMGQFVELAVLSVSIVVPARRLRDVHYNPKDYCTNKDVSVCNFNGVLISLKIFYTIVLANAIIAAAGVIYSKTILFALVDNPSYALRRYYHSIVWNCVVKGLLHSTDLDLVQFAFEIQAMEYKNNKRAVDVMQMYSDLMTYLYEHPHHKGFEAAKVGLDSSNVFMKEAAANLVGCWISLGISGCKTLLMQETLLSKLADAVDHEETGRAATSSFEQMAGKFAKETVQVKNSGGKWLVEILMRRINQVVLQEKPDKAIVFLKVLVKLIDSEGVGCQGIISCFQDGSSALNNFEEDLLRIVESARYKRTRAVACYALLKLLLIKEDREKAMNDIQSLLDLNSLKRAADQNREGTQQAIEQLTTDQDSELDCSKSVICTVICFLWNNFIMLPVKFLCSVLFIKLCSSILKGISFLWDCILDISVGKDPATADEKDEHILKNEADYIIKAAELIKQNAYLKKIIDLIGASYPKQIKDIIDQINYLDDNAFNEMQLPEVLVRDIGSEKSKYVKLPRWLRDTKATNYNLAVIMVFLTVGFCSFFIFYQGFHF